MESKKKIKKVNWTNIVRRAVQIAAFIFMPGLFISTFASIKSIYTAAISGTFDASALMPQIFIIIAVIPLTIIVGRFFCGFLCSFGAIGDFIWFISKKVWKSKPKINPKADKILKGFKYVLLAFIVVFVWTLGAVVIDPDHNPWNIFGMYTALSGWTSLSALFTVGGLLLLLIFAGTFFVERFFCRYMCPLGAVFAIISKFRIFRIKKPAEACKSCKVCTNNCPMGIDMYKHDVIKSGECTDCFECIAPCPRQNAQVSIAGRAVQPIAIALLVSAAMAAIYFAGKGAVQSAYAEPAELPAYISQSEDPGPYTDGVYTGTAEGYRGETTVEVTIGNGYITGIQVLSTDDDMEYFLPAQSSVVNDIIQTQSPDVDVISGATYSSDAIKFAVTDALLKCPGMEDGMDMPMMMKTDEPVEVLSEEELEAIEENPLVAELEDGVYTGAGKGYYGDTVVDVTVEGGKITAVEVVSTADDRPYLESAEDVIGDVIVTQDVEVDTVSGATVSSNGILEAVADALGLDYERAAEAEGEHGGGGGGNRGRGGGGGGH
jgi:uncharacterized protein with FMN-binding domain